MTKQTSEYIITIQVAEYLEYLKTQGKILQYSHVPNETYTPSWSAKIKNKRMGVKPGIPDMIIVYPSNVLFLELKKEKGGVLSSYQKEWIISLEQVAGNVHIKVAKGFDQAKEIIDSLL